MLENALPNGKNETRLTFRSRRSSCARLERTDVSQLLEEGSKLKSAQHRGHFVIGLAQHAGNQPDATPEARALAQRLAQRHLKPEVRDV